MNDDGSSAEEWLVVAILAERACGPGGRDREYLVRWQGHALQTWENRETCEELEALDNWLAFASPARDKNGNLPQSFHRDLSSQRS